MFAAPVRVYGAMESDRPFWGKIAMQSMNFLRGASRRALSCVVGGTVLVLGSCGQEPLKLPADMEESAALCYGATLASRTGQVSFDQAVSAAQFALLGGSLNGVGEATKVDSVGARGNQFRNKLTAEKNAKAYLPACAKAFPETDAGTFKDLPGDNPDTRMMCYTLSTALLQIFDQSQIASDPRAASYLKLNTRLDQALAAELQAAGDTVNPGELAGRAMRGLAQAVRLGPAADVMQACNARYLPR